MAVAPDRAMNALCSRDPDPRRIPYSPSDSLCGPMSEMPRETPAVPFVQRVASPVQQAVSVRGMGRAYTEDPEFPGN